MRKVIASALVAAVSVGLGSVSAAAQEPDHYYSTKTPYEPQGKLRSYAQPPRGFTPVFTENVTRHGSRAMSDAEDADVVLELLARAGTQVTPLGAGLGPQVRTLVDGALKIGYGNLAGRGRAELAGQARRVEQRLPGLFAKIAAAGSPVEVVTSGQTRAIDSANAYTGTLAADLPALAPLLRAPRTDKNLLYFHKSAANADYQDYVDNDPRLAGTIAAIEDQKKTANTADRVVSRLFAPAFTGTLTDEEKIGFARSLWSLYTVVPALSAEAPGVDLDPFVDDKDAHWFGYLDDAEEFYSKGPGFQGDDITYKMAGVLLDDLFRQVEAKRDGTSTMGAVLRFTHAEEVMPLAVLMGLPGTTVQASPASPYTYGNNPWRNADVAPMGANLQWDVYRDGAGRFLVRMLFNERELPVKAACTAFPGTSTFYDLDELKRCFGRA